VITEDGDDMERDRTEQLLEQMYLQLDDAISKRNQDVARYMYGQIAGALMLALYLQIISEQEHDQRYDALQDKFYDAFNGR
jgi:replication initiation and membrane attachment protein DnaB